MRVVLDRMTTRAQAQNTKATTVLVAGNESDMTNDKSSHFALTKEIIRASNLRTEQFRSRKPDRYIGVTCAVNLKGRTWQAHPWPWC